MKIFNLIEKYFLLFFIFCLNIKKKKKFEDVSIKLQNSWL